MGQVIRITGSLEQLPVKNIQHVGEEGARRGQAVLPDGREIPVYNHPENGLDVWHEQEAPSLQSGVCVVCERSVTALNSMGVCEGCVMQAAIDAQERY